MTDLRAVTRAIACRRRTCLAQPGGYCRSRTGNNTATHAERIADAEALTPDQQDAVVEAERARLVAARDIKPLTAEQLAIRARTGAAWARICQEVR